MAKLSNKGWLISDYKPPEGLFRWWEEEEGLVEINCAVRFSAVTHFMFKTGNEENPKPGSPFFIVFHLLGSSDKLLWYYKDHSSMMDEFKDLAKMVRL